MNDGRTYEMLWDCKFCGSKKLLGKTHRHCPNCGAPQDHTSRYYPADNEKVAVEDHRFVGADLRCGSCGEANSAAAKHCGNCGGPLEGAQSVTLRGDQVQAEGAAASSEIARLGTLSKGSSQAQGTGKSGPGSGRRIGCIVASVLVLVLLGLSLFFFWKKPTTLEVTGHRWTRTIEVERFQTVQERAWCNELPPGARVLSREKQERSRKQVADGEECSLRKKDRGDGTFTEVRECKPKYREEPVYDEHCRFEIERWSPARTEKATGNSVTQTPVWPDARPQPEGQCLGCERLGKREAKYTVLLRDQGTGDAAECDLEEAAWRGYSPGQNVKGEIRRIGGGVDCSSLAPAK